MMPFTTDSSFLNSVIDIVKEASSLMLTDSFEISEKGSSSNIVTSSDMAVQDFLCKRLSELLPGSGFLCEEKDVRDTSHEYTWIIDPIDGTCNYSRGISMCAICVGLKHNLNMEIGVVYLPISDELFMHKKGKVLFLMDVRYMYPTGRLIRLYSVRHFLFITKSMQKYAQISWLMFLKSVMI